MILMDTHVLVWLLDGDRRLHPDAVDAMQFSLQQQRLFVSAASYGELALLESSGAIDFGVGLDIWRVRRMESGIKEIPGHFPIVEGTLDFLDAQPHPKPTPTATLDRQQVSLERLQAIVELGLLRGGQSFQVAQK